MRPACPLLSWPRNRLSVLSEGKEARAGGGVMRSRLGRCLNTNDPQLAAGNWP